MEQNKVIYSCYFFHHSTGNSSQKNWSRKRNKDNQIRKEEAKLVLFVDNIILNIEIPKECTKNLLGLMNNFNNFVGCNINIQKSVAFLYANNELFKKLRQQPYLQLHQK